MDISVIIPVYNVELYIEECLESVINQTLKKNIEYIIVNDGSKDNSQNIIEKIIQKYHNFNIKLITKQNGGLSSARNVGLRHATGKYVAFVDSDDIIQSVFLENLFIVAEKNNLDIALGGYTYLTSNNQYKYKYRDSRLFDLGVIDGEEALQKQIIYNDYRMEVWDDLYNRDFLLKNNLFFEEGLIYEDEDFTVRALISAKRVKFIENYTYLYRIRENSIMNSIYNEKQSSSLIKILRNFIQLYNQANEPLTKLILAKLSLNMLNNFIIRSSNLSKDIKSKQIHEIPYYEIREIAKTNRLYLDRLSYICLSNLDYKYLNIYYIILKINRRLKNEFMDVDKAI